ncbi:SspB family protein [Candidatus Nucleicultrix amoebiphila]|nr:ClpXP protease specificity-enhancing factor SspB [Candidatus Nucleicultrix amoebiphila]
MRHFNYDAMVHDALLGIVKSCLRFVEKNGLPGNNHFYVTFNTNREDVIIPQELRDSNPEEVTIVLQHQFWDLHVFDDHFEVVLSFQDRYEKISIPFSALVSFLDPSSNFGLQFIPDLSEEEKKKQESTKKQTEPAKSKGKDKEKGKTPKSKGDEPQPQNNIISLDSFRKK